MNKKSFLANLVGWMVTILTPFVLLLTAVRLMMTPMLLNLEYRMPGFPEDPYGFSMEERLQWSKLSMEYLLNSDSIEFFSPYKLPDGSPLYNDRELSHMDDVKRVVAAGRNIWLGILVLFVGLSLGLSLRGHHPTWLSSIRRGGWLLIGMMLALVLSIILSFDKLFTQFHNLFFASGTWTFYYSDTFIRLFPIRFWQDCFIYSAILSVIAAIVFIWWGRKH
jgi:integral membrane protein (TIGR01906 family)